MIKIEFDNLVFIVVFFFFTVLMTLLYMADVALHTFFYIAFVVIFLLRKPSRAISPLSFFYGYYGVFYVLAPMFASRYQDDSFNKKEYSLSFLFVYIVFTLGIYLLEKGRKSGMSVHPVSKKTTPTSDRMTLFIIIFLFFISTLMLYLIISHSGGLQRWLSAPGEAFLNRGGSGLYVVISHFSSEILAALVGYYANKTKKYFWLYVFIFWVLATSPVHGSKLQISLLLILAFIPWINRIKFYSLKSLMFFVTFIFLFFLGLYFRNLSWIESSTLIPYALNYFTALENLATSVRDFEPDFLRTWFLPFNKFLSPFGMLKPDFYFDMNHWLTDIYFPKAWEIRATEQWPVETDLYLNFYFFGGLPLVGLYLYIVGYTFGYATKKMTLGAWFAAILLAVGLISHMRGSLYNYIDFYMYPFIFLVFNLLKNFKINND